MPSNNSRTLARQNPGNWAILSNNGTTVTAKNRITGENFSGTVAQIKAIWTVAALPVEEANFQPTSDGCTKVVDAKGLGVYFGSGAPTITAAKGSLYMNTTGSGPTNRMYVNTDGAATWTSAATAA
jgi:hypothetical protein